MRWLLALLLWLAAAGAQAQQIEVIRDFTARIEVQTDGSVEVTEEIEVVALGQAIRRGIYRDLRLRTMGPMGLFQADFALHEATRNGEPETSRVERTGPGIRIWLGHPDVMLPHGVHRYRLRYRITDEVRRQEGFDEFYWNVNGTEWAFPAMRVSAEVVLPEGATIMQRAAYTGYAGQQGRDFRVTEGGARRIGFATTRPLAAGENLTVAVGFPTGVVTHSDRFAWLEWLVGQNPLHVGAGLLALLLTYYVAVWYRVGRNPRGGPIIPIYCPELPPAAMRYIRRMSFDGQCTAAAVLNLAVKGYLTLDEDAKGEITLTRATPRPGAPQPSPGEAVLLAQLLGVRERITLAQTNQRTLSTAQSALRRHMDANFNRVFFNWNSFWSWLGILMTVLGWLVLSLTQPDLLEAVPLLLVMGVLGAATLALPVNAWAHLRRWRSGGDAANLVAALATIFLTVIMGSALATGVAMVSGVFGWELPAATLALIAVNVLFRYLLKAPTEIGRKALDEIEGTRLYLTVAEADRLRFHNPPDRTPEHFEAMLPYAVALGVETAWTRQFSDVLARASTATEGGYRPRWYHGGRFSGARLSALGAAVGSSYGAAAAPKSSGGGSGGRGSSGGGGGGRGGGGW